MTARVLIVDDIAVNVRLLEARLTAEYYAVVTASSGREALDICRDGAVDIVLLDVMMPEMDGFAVCRALKADPETQHIPVVMITALDQPSDRVRGLEAGADDFLTKPVDDMQLLARVRSLIRLKSLTDELRARARTGQEIAIERTAGGLAAIDADGGRVLIVDTEARRAERIEAHLAAGFEVERVSQPADVVLRVADGHYELALVSMALDEHDPLRICSQIRTLEQTRNLPLILMAEEADRPRIVRGLDLGVNDFIMRPIERNELLARVRTQIRRYRYTMELRRSVTQTLALAVTDELTGLYNRRYFDRHLSLMLAKAEEQKRNMAVLLIDIDFFKAVNDTYGHDIGDTVLREFAARLRRNVRAIDLACRYGGEEFVVLMPDTDFAQAQAVAERIRRAVAQSGFDVAGTRALTITVSVGVALREEVGDTPDMILKRADVALYRAKREGRNRVVFDAA